MGVFLGSNRLKLDQELMRQMAERDQSSSGDSWSPEEKASIAADDQAGRSALKSFDRPYNQETEDRIAIGAGEEPDDVIGRADKEQMDAMLNPPMSKDDEQLELDARSNALASRPAMDSPAFRQGVAKSLGADEPDAEPDADEDDSPSMVSQLMDKTASRDLSGLDEETPSPGGYSVTSPISALGSFGPAEEPVKDWATGEVVGTAWADENGNYMFRFAAGPYAGQSLQIPDGLNGDEIADWASAMNGNPGIRVDGDSGDAGTAAAQGFYNEVESSPEPKAFPRDNIDTKARMRIQSRGGVRRGSDG